MTADHKTLATYCDTTNESRRKADSQSIRFHDLRHIHATMLLQMGEHPKVVSECLGHSPFGFTMDVYSHVMPDMQKDAADNFEKMMKQKRSK
ncbi:tyrosine-type recombinase/integrase [Brevibacillus formosus]|uniref:tyrosine-type recombinase/integrase n=1 Tax=Brevibacillus formosus TaxID=54913 RepID=UPI001CA51BDE|nr:tyrosine-type recombinase/integrase [Brevibacillus formosus]